ncbi:MAG TPA: hypothetical protein ENH82_10780 [bacterium]|nr:hypothetical protein [bacterium]
MRDIKFRAWNIKLKQMGKVFQIDFEAHGVWVTFFNKELDANEGDFWEDKDIILMQYIGRKDKKEVEIYEGDDVDVKMSFEGGTLPHRGYIVYDKEFGAFGTKNDAGITLLHNHCLHTLEVIGNVHDSPELLKD